MKILINNPFFSLLGGTIERVCYFNMFMSDKIKPEIKEQVFNKYNGHCAYCGSKPKVLTIDHIIPYRRKANAYELEKYGRGKNHIDNYNPCCLSCNSSKSTFSIEQWRKEIKLKHSRLIRDNSSYRLLERFGLVREAKEVLFYFEKLL